MRFINYIKELFNRRLLVNLKNKADKLAKKKKIQYLVVPVNDKGKMIVVPGYAFMESYNKTAKKHGLKKINYPELLKIAVYKTAL